MAAFVFAGVAVAQDVGERDIGIGVDNVEGLRSEDSGYEGVPQYETDVDRYKSSGAVRHFGGNIRGNGIYDYGEGYDDEYENEDIGDDDPDNLYYRGNWGMRYYAGDPEVFYRRYADRFVDDEASRYREWVSRHYDNEDYESDYYDKQYFKTEQFEISPEEESPGEETSPDADSVPPAGAGERYYSKDWERGESKFDKWYKDVLVYKPGDKGEENSFDSRQDEGGSR